MITGAGTSDFVANVSSLRQSLFNNYDEKVRPDATTAITVSLSLSKLNKLVRIFFFCHLRLFPSNMNKIVTVLDLCTIECFHVSTNTILTIV